MQRRAMGGLPKALAKEPRCTPQVSVSEVKAAGGACNLCPTRHLVQDHLLLPHLHAPSIHGQHPQATPTDGGLGQGNAHLLILACRGADR